MAYKEFVAAFCTIIAASAGSATGLEPSLEGAPAASAGAKYCLRVEPVTGSRIETTRCETREEWARLEVDLDKEWPKEGVRVIG